MNALIRRAIQNTPAMNTVMIALLALGALSLFSMRREVFPEFDLEIILVTIPYPGASPDEVEEGICQKIEEAVRSVDGIKKQTSVAKEGAGSVVLELETSADPQRVLSEVRSEVDRIPSFPLLAEDPEVKQITMRQPAITVGIVQTTDGGPDTERRLREIAEAVREDLIRIPEVSQANIAGAKAFQIDVEIDEDTLRRYGLSLRSVASLIRAENLELPGGTIRTQSQEILVKGKNKGTIGSEIEQIPLVTQPNGVVLTVGDLGVVRDEFADVESSTWINGRPGLAITVERTTSEDLLAMTDAVHEYVRTTELPPGYQLETWGDRSVEVRDRLDLLTENGLQGLALVLVMLALFLNLRLAWWVAVGIPISILGACFVLYFGGQTLNMLTTFTFVMALGIVVDDAIVVGENVHAHRLMGKNPLRAAIDGTVEVAPSVAASVATTIIAFMPLLFVSGVMGKFIGVMPLAMIAILLLSLFESLFILPCHLAHEAEGDAPRGPLAAVRGFNTRLPRVLGWTIGPLLLAVAWVLDLFVYPIMRLNDFVTWLNEHTDRVLEFISRRVYSPVLLRSVKNPAVAVSVGVSLLLVAGGLVAGGFVPFVVFPKLDSNTIEASILFPDGTPASVVETATARLENAIQEVDRRYRDAGDPVLRLTRQSVGYRATQSGPIQSEASGSHIGSVTAELLDVSQRTVESEEILRQWRAAVGQLPGAESLTFSAGGHGPGGTPIEFKLLADAKNMESLEEAVAETKNRLEKFAGVFDVRDDSTPGKWEFQLRVKEDAVAMGVPLQDVAQTVRASYYGEEVMRLQRGRYEVKLMVRYPREDRRSLAEFDQIRVRGADGVERPLTELADVNIERGYSEINRVDQLRSITISADIDESVANASEIVRRLQTEFMPDLFERHPGVSVRWEGQQEQSVESIQSLMVGLGVALLAMFALLTFQFTSYFQPLIIMAIIPFGVVGAIFGHAIMGLPLTLFSLFGLVTLTGVVVNDSIVLIDFINHRVRDGIPVTEALLDAGNRRLRPIFLTSVTTIAGLFPLILETSFQAQILIPMAVSICFGLALSTALVLLLVPTFYQLHAQLTGVVAGEEKAERDEQLLPVSA